MKNRITALFLAVVSILTMLTAPASAATRSTTAPDTIKMEDCTHNGVSYVSPSLGTCYLHQMTFDYNKQSTIGFCAERARAWAGPWRGTPGIIPGPFQTPLYRP